MESLEILRGSDGFGSIPMSGSTPLMGKYQEPLENVQRLAMLLQSAQRNALESVQELISKNGPSSTKAEISTEEALFDARLKAKVATSTIATHLTREWRDRFFGQVDALLDKDEWDARDVPVTEASFRTFLRLVVFLGNANRPGLAATSHGNLLAIWRNRDNRLTLECKPNDSVKWIVSRQIDEADPRLETAAGETIVARLPKILRPFGWF